MRITAEEMTLVLDHAHGRQLRRMMRLPVTHNHEADERKCPMKVGSAYKLSDGTRETWIMVTAVRRERLGDLTDGDVRREGYKSRGEALFALLGFNMLDCELRWMWVISFVGTGNEPSPLSDTPVFLSGDGGYTTVAGLQSVPGDPEVAIVDESEGERARVLALALREAPTREQVEGLLASAETLRETMLSMKARRRAALIVREIEKLRGEVVVAEVPPDAVRCARAAG